MRRWQWGRVFEPRSFQKPQRCLCSCSGDLLRVTRLLPAVSASGFLAHRRESHRPQLLSRTSQPSRGDGKVPFAPLGFLTAGLGPFCWEAAFSRSSFICWFAGAAEGRRHLTSRVVCRGSSGALSLSTLGDGKNWSLIFIILRPFPTLIVILSSMENVTLKEFTHRVPLDGY